MKRILIIVLMILAGIAMMAKSQDGNTLRGRVLEKESGEPVGWATVALMTADSTLVAGTTCKEDGSYELKAAPGQYLLTASLIGYKDCSREITLGNSGSETETLYLETDAQMLEGARLTERVPLVEIKIDKVVMNVRESAFAQGSDALELMKKAPGVTIDKDGNIKLNGKSVAVWIDGRPSYVDGKALEALLKSTNSESIDKFELMEHPSAKYDAAGQGGIINIKTKRNLLQGFNGSMGLGGGGMYFKDIDETPLKQSYWANLAFRGKKTNTFLNVYESSETFPIHIINDMNAEVFGFHQTGNTLHLEKSFNYNVKMGNDWFIDDKNTLGVIFFVPGSVDGAYSKYSDTKMYRAGVLEQEDHTVINNGPNNSIQHNLNVNYTHIFSEERASEITANLDYYHNLSEDMISQVDTVVSTSAPLSPSILRKTMRTDNFYNIYSAKADYQSVVWKKFMLEAGGKWSLSHTDNTSLETETLMPDRATDFIYRENIGAAYVSLAGQLGPKWSFKAGLRGEYTNSFGDWKTSQSQTTRDYFDIFPTAFIGWQASEKLNLHASYTRRIDRPRYSQLNPTKMYVDAKTYTMGNPDILPQYSNGLGLGASFGQHLSMSLGYDFSHGIINQIPSYDLDGTQYLTWGNFGDQKIGAASVNVAALPVAKWLQWTASVTGLLGNSTSATSGITRDICAAFLYTDFTFLLPKDWKIDLDAFYQSPMTFGCYNMHTMWSSNLAVKKNFLEDKLTLTIRLDDIFRSMNTNLDILDESGTGGTTALQQLYSAQKLVLDLTWNFGKAQKPMKQRKVGGFEEMNRVGSGSNGTVGK